MARSKASTVEAYLAELPPERRAVVAAVRDVVRRNLPDGYQESMNWGMISWEIPLETYRGTSNGQPLSYAGLAAQKNYYSLYLMSAYAEGREEGWLREAFRKAGKTLDMGKCCVRFRSLEDLELDAIAKVVAGTPPQAFIAMFEASHRK
jgi:uncharacterized protein YdhG (YjbR/CyaY superfamily)